MDGTRLFLGEQQGLQVFQVPHFALLKPLVVACLVRAQVRISGCFTGDRLADTKCVLLVLYSFDSASGDLY